MKNTVLLLLTFVLCVTVANAQNEFITVNDFENDPVDWRRDAENNIIGWVIDSHLTAIGEPHHGGEKALRIDVLNTGGWGSSYYQFPDPVDATKMDEFRVWVYSEDVFRLRVEIGPGLIVGFNYYGLDDVGNWKEFVFWISEEQAVHWRDQLSPADELRLIINPSETSLDEVLYPNGFEGTIYMDDMRMRKRIPVEREYHTLIGFNEYYDEDYVRLSGGTYFEVLLDEGPTPPEGNGILMFEYTQSWTSNITIDLKEFPEILEYDRIHFDIFVDGSSWATTSMRLRTSQWIDENGEPRGTSWTVLSDNNLGTAVGGDWAELSGHYGPLDSEGNIMVEDGNHTIEDLRQEISGVFDDPNASISLTITSQGSSANDGVLAYIDNLRLSRPSTTGVSNWELW